MTYSDSEFTAIMDKYGDTVLRICYVRLGNKQDAEDVFQEVFISLYRAKNKPQDEFLKPWLIKTACNKCVSFFRSRKKTVILEDSAVAPDSEFDNTVENAILSLEKKQRTCIYLFYYERLSVNEISEILKFSEANVRQLLFRARKKLKEILKEDYFE